MKTEAEKSSDSIPEDVLARFRQRNAQGWKQILSMTDVLDKRAVELSIAGEEDNGFDPYDTSDKLPRLTVRAFP